MNDPDDNQRPHPDDIEPHEGAGLPNPYEDDDDDKRDVVGEH